MDLPLLYRTCRVIVFCYKKVHIWLGICFALFCLVEQSNAQTLDSLKGSIATMSLEERIDILKQTGEIQMNSRPKEAISFFEELVRLAEENQDLILKVYSLNRIGNCWYNQNDLGQSIQFYFKALAATENKTVFNDLKARINNNLGWSFKKLEEFDKALKYFKEAEQYARLTNDKKSLALILNNKGVTEKDVMQYEQALISLRESLSLNREIGDKRQERFNLNNISVIHINQKQFTQAKENLLQLKLLNESMSDTVELLNNYQNLGEAYMGLQDEKNAAYYFTQAIQLSKKIRNIQARKSLLAEISKFYRAQKNFEQALAYADAFYQLADSLRTQETKLFALELETKYDAVVKEKELEKAHKELTEQKLYATWFIGALVFTLVGVCIVVRILLVKRKNERKLIALNHEIEAQSEELKQANEEIHAINENLEEILEKRTKLIREQNERLKQFAFVNAHKIRGPVATILGLTNLISITSDGTTKDELLKHLHTSSLKLDAVIKEVSKQLDTDSSSENNP